MSDTPNLTQEQYEASTAEEAMARMGAITDNDLLQRVWHEEHPRYYTLQDIARVMMAILLADFDAQRMAEQHNAPEEFQEAIREHASEGMFRAVLLGYQLGLEDAFNADALLADVQMTEQPCK